MSKNQKSTGSAVFYKPITNAEEIRAGYLHKSPPHKHLKAEWKRRYFVLYKIGENDYQLRYSRSQEDKSNSLGAIDLSQITLMYGNPQHHQKWLWVQKAFKCSPSCVLYIRVGSRDYFLIAETSNDADSWFNDLFEALKHRPHKFLTSEELSNGQAAVKDISNPITRGRNCTTGDEKAPFFLKKEDGTRLELTFDPQVRENRSMSDPTWDEMQKESGNRCKRPTSEPVAQIYDYPRSYRIKQSEENGIECSKSMGSIYESMSDFQTILALIDNISTDQEESNDSQINRDNSIRSPTSRPNSAEWKLNGDKLENRQSSEFSSSSSGAISPIEIPANNSDRKSSIDSLDNDITEENRSRSNSIVWKLHLTSPAGEERSSSLDCTSPVDPELSVIHPNVSPPGDNNLRKSSIILEERDFIVNQAELKKHLTLAEVDGKPSVSNWMGQPQTVCLFHRGDHILAVNDIHTGSVDEFHMLLSKVLKAEVKVTILRKHGSQPLHQPMCPCTD